MDEFCEAGDEEAVRKRQVKARLLYFQAGRHTLPPLRLCNQYYHYLLPLLLPHASATATTSANTTTTTTTYYRYDHRLYYVCQLA